MHRPPFWARITKKKFSLVLVFFFPLEPAAANDAVVGKGLVYKRAQQLGSVPPLDVGRGAAGPRLEKMALEAPPQC